MYVNDLPQQTTTSSVALFADDTKCYRAISKAQDIRDLQCDFDRINKWCQVWRMTLNQSKCGVHAWYDGFSDPPELVTPSPRTSAMPRKNSRNLVYVKSKKLFLLLELFYNYKCEYKNI